MLKIVFPALLGLSWLVPVSAQDDFSPGYHATYKVNFEADWSEQTHPQDFPSNPHFSGLVGATHSQDARLWKSGELATPGIKSMAETGAKGPLLNEVDDLISDGTAEFALSGPGIGVSPGVATMEIEISQGFPLVSLTSMITPSPDWFVGVDRLFISVAWFTYSMGEQMWLIGSADITEGDETATVELFRTSGTGFGDAFNADDVLLDAHRNY